MQMEGVPGEVLTRQSFGCHLGDVENTGVAARSLIVLKGETRSSAFMWQNYRQTSTSFVLKKRKNTRRSGLNTARAKLKSGILVWRRTSIARGIISIFFFFIVQN